MFGINLLALLIGAILRVFISADSGIHW